MYDNNHQSSRFVISFSLAVYGAVYMLDVFACWNLTDAGLGLQEVIKFVFLGLGTRSETALLIAQDNKADGHTL